MNKISFVLFFVMSFISSAIAETPGESDTADAPEARIWVTNHQAKIGNKTLRYTVSAGTMLMKDEDDKPIALIGYTAYVADGADQGKRPLMFAYNGGPGSASLWLHMGVLGPQRAVINDGGFTDNGPFERVANEHSIIDIADLVLIDPVGTGFAKAVGDAKGEDFWGVDQDATSVSDFIAQYVTQNKRWASPKFILGESYGGMRSGAVAYQLLTRHMIALNGVVLVSPFMELATGFAGRGIDLPHIMFLPTFAATAWYHDALANKPADLVAFVDEVERFALGEYASALLLGDRLDHDKRQAVIEKLAQFTGLDADYWERANLRINEGRFTKELFRRRGITVGRIDSRFVGNMINRVGESQAYDPMLSAIGPPYLAAFMDYYSRDLKVEDIGTYKVFGNVFGKWDWGHRQPDVGHKLPFANTAIDLALTMTQNPSMKVLVQQGYFDLATPHLATEYYLDHLDIADELRKNIVLEYYEAGHMMYVHEPSLVKFKKDLAEFVLSAH